MKKYIKASDYAPVQLDSNTRAIITKNSKDIITEAKLLMYEMEYDRVDMDHVRFAVEYIQEYLNNINDIIS